MARPEGRLERPEGRAVFFDLDDTLFDHTRTARRALRAVVRSTPALRHRPFDQLYRRYAELLERVQPDLLAGRTTREIARDERFRSLFEFCGSTVSPAVAHHSSEAYRSEYQRLRSAVPGARALLAALRPIAVVGIISNNEQAEQLDKLRAVRLEPYLDLVVTSEAARASKPDPAIFAHALRQARVSARSAVMVGDNWSFDVEGAVASGFRAVWYNRWKADRPRSSTPATEIHSLHPSSALLRALVPRRVQSRRREPDPRSRTNR